MRAALALALLLLAPAGAAAQAHLLVVSGLGGEARYSDDFHDWGTSLGDAARERFAIPAERVVYLSENPARDAERIAGRATKENIEAAIREIARRAAPTDRVMIVLIGHGSSDSRGARLNIPGPNLEAVEFAAMLEALSSQPLVVVNTASASGGFQDPLAGPNRTVITATRSGMERNETIFGRYFVEAFTRDGADTDHDGRVSVQEAFEYATREVERFYRQSNLLQMEHARLEGDADLARVFHLGSRALAASADASPELRELYAERQRLEEAIESLQTRREQLGDAFAGQLEGLLLDLARTNRQIRELEGDG
jgi:hypothetical protein